MAINEIKTRVLNIISDVEEDQHKTIDALIANMIDAVNLYCGTDTLPTELEFIVVETTVARYNRLGSEGISQEQIDSLGTSFAQDLLAPYKPSMDRYVKSNQKKINKLRLI